MKTPLPPLPDFFKAHALSPLWLEGISSQQLSVEVAIWGALWEKYNLPWMAVLAATETENTNLLNNYPYLNRLWQAYEANNGNGKPRGEATTTAPLRIAGIQKIVLVEGQSERCLLPALSKALGLCLQEHGIWILASGGKSATLRKCLSLLSWVNVPIAVLLDADAQAEAEQLEQLALQLPEKHPALNVCVLREGELEDTYPLNWVYAVLAKLEVGQEKECVASPFIAHGLPARIPSFTVFEAFVLDAKTKGERASETFRRFWLAWGYPTFDKRELAEGIAKVVEAVGAETLENNSLKAWLQNLQNAKM